MRFIRKMTTVVATVALAATGFLGTTTAFADAPVADAPAVVQSDAVVQGGAWLPWDRANITTMKKCEARLAYLRKTYKDLNISNSKCTAVKIAQCPPKTVYWVMVLDHGSAAKKAKAVQNKEFALAC